MSQDIPLPVRFTDIPQYHLMPEDDFELLCADLFGEEDGISNSEPYGRRGYAQKGIDVYAWRTAGDGIEVGQCKCYQPKDITVTLLKEVSDEFFKYWNHWSQEKVKRFVLFVASPANTPSLIEERTKQIQRFGTHNIQYEVWDARQITRKLEPHPHVVRRYLPKEWVPRICGREFDVSLHVQSHLTSIIPSTTVTAAGQLTDHVTLAEIERARQLWREGKRGEAEQIVSKLHDILDSISHDMRAQLLRFEARLALENGALAEVHILQEAALGFNPVSDVGLDVLLMLKEKGLQETYDWSRTQAAVPAHLLAALQLDTENVELALGTLNNLPEAQQDAEIFRLKALAYLLQGDLTNSHISIEQAYQLQPRWTHIMYAKAVIHYVSSLSPSARSSFMVAWPEPLDWSLIRRDPSVLKLLDEANQLLLELMNLPSSLDEVSRLQIWRVACLSNHPHRQAEAESLVKEILESDPTDYRAFTWALARRMDIDYRASLRALGKLISIGAAQLEHIQVLVNYHLSENAYSRVQELLNQTRNVFRAAGQQEMWFTWHLAVRAALKPNLPLPAPDPSRATPDTRKATIRVLGARATQSNDWMPLATYLLQSYETTKDANFLLGYCEIMAQESQWDAIAPYSDIVLDQVRTSYALHLVAFVRFYLHQYQAFITLLEEYQHWFPENMLPIELRVMRVKALNALGMLIGARQEAEDLVRGYPSTPNLTLLMQLLIETGDLVQASVVARQLLTQSDLPPELALRSANVLRLVSQAQAVTLMEVAYQKGIPNDLVGQAVALANELEIDAHNPMIRDLMSRLIVLGQEGELGIKVATLDEIREILQQERTFADNALGLYRKGHIPVHFLVPRLRAHLTNLYHLGLTNVSTLYPAQYESVYVRHGSRIIPPPLEMAVTDVRLHADITAILLAHHFNLLDKIETYFQPIRIPHTFQTTLIEESTALEHVQPERLLAYRQILALLHEHKLSVATPDHLQDPQWLDSGWCVNFHNNDNEAAITVVGIEDLLNTLHRAGFVAQHRYEELLEHLDTQSYYVAGQMPLARAQVFLTPGIAQTLAQWQILVAATVHFQLFIDEFEVQQMRAEIDAHAQSLIAKEWIDNLRERIRNGLESGIYQVIPIAELPREALQSFEDYASLEVGLGVLVSYPTVPGDIIWIEDRHVTRTLFRENAKIVSLVDLVTSLREPMGLSEGEYYAIFQEMRASGLRFIPFTAEEIFYYLQRAPVEGDLLEESRDLVVLRRYYAGLVLSEGVVQAPVSEGDHGELDWFLEAKRTLANTLVLIWSSEASAEQCARWSKWLLDALYYETLNFQSLLGEEHNRDNYDTLAALSLSQLILVAYQLPSTNVLRRIEYGKWLEDSFLSTRLWMQPELQTQLLESLKQILVSVADAVVGKDQGIKRLVLNYSLDSLPNFIRSELLRSTTLMDTFGLDTVTVISLGNIPFRSADFWDGMTTAQLGTVFTIEAFNQERISFKTNDIGKVGFFRESAPDLVIYPDESLQYLALSDISRIEQFLRTRRAWFDMDDELFDIALQSILVQKNAKDRYERAAEYLETSPKFLYLTLVDRLRNKESLTQKDLMISQEALLRYLGLESWDKNISDLSSDLLDHAALVLIQRFGLSIAIQRLWSLPIPLSSQITNIVVSYSRSQWATLIHDLLPHAVSPLAKIHLLRLISIAKQFSPKYLRFARWLTNFLTSEKGLQSLESLQRLVLWSLTHFTSAVESRDHFTQRVVASWCHAHHLFHHWHIAGFNVDALANDLKDRVPGFAEYMRARYEDPQDVSHPLLLQGDNLLLGGLSYALGPVDDELLDPWITTLIRPSDKYRQRWMFRILEDRRRLNNHLHSFLGDVDGRLIPWLTGLEDFHVDHELLIQESLVRLRENANDLSAWLLLSALWVSYPIPIAYASEIETIADSIDLSQNTDIQSGLFQFNRLVDFLSETQNNARYAQYVEYWRHLVSTEGQLSLEDETTLMSIMLQLSLWASTHEQAHKELADLLKILQEKTKFRPYLFKLIEQTSLFVKPNHARFYENIIAFLRRL